MIDDPFRLLVSSVLLPPGFAVEINTQTIRRTLSRDQKRRVLDVQVAYRYTEAPQRRHKRHTFSHVHGMITGVSLFHPTETTVAQTSAIAMTSRTISTTSQFLRDLPGMRKATHSPSQRPYRTETHINPAIPHAVPYTTWDGSNRMLFECTF